MQVHKKIDTLACCCFKFLEPGRFRTITIIKRQCLAERKRNIKQAANKRAHCCCGCLVLHLAQQMETAFAFVTAKKCSFAFGSKDEACLPISKPGSLGNNLRSG